MDPTTSRALRTLLRVLLAPLLTWLWHLMGELGE